MEAKAFYIMILISGLVTAYITNYIAPIGIFGFLIIFPLFFSIGKKLYPRTEKDDLKKGAPFFFMSWFGKGLHYECKDCGFIGDTKKSMGKRKAIFIFIDVLLYLIAGVAIQRGYSGYGISIIILSIIFYYTYSTERYICTKCDSKNIKSIEK